MAFLFINLFTALGFVAVSHANPIREVDNDSLEVKRAIEKSADSLFSVNVFYQTKVPCNDSYTGRLDDLDARIAAVNEKLTIKIPQNQYIEKKLMLFVNQYEDFLRGAMYRSYFYFSMFEEALERHNLPQELKYLAVIESGLNPHAKSWVGATGLWQFMQGTGRSYGLQVNNYIDERSNPVEATEAACKYLKSLYETFGDWGLAIAAYNSGPGGVRKAIKKSRHSKDFWEIRKYLPKETAHYFPSFLAITYIFEHAKQMGFDYDASKTFLSETELVRIKKTVSISLVSDKIDLDDEVINFLNPSYRKGVVPVLDENSAVQIRLPKAFVATFFANENDIYESSLSIPEYDPEYIKNSIATHVRTIARTRKVYTVRKGDTLSDIAKKYKGVSARNLMAWNHLRSSKIRPGMKIRVSPN